MSFWGLYTFKISQVMIFIQTDRYLFLNKTLVYVLLGIYVEIGQKWLMAICSKRFLGPTRFNSLHHKYYDIW